MVKFKKIFILLICMIICVSPAFMLVGCKKNDLKKVSKNLTSYAISAEVLSEDKITAKETIEYVNQTESELNNLCLHLYPRAFREDAIIKPYTALTMASCFPNGQSYGDMEIVSVKVNDKTSEKEIVGEDEDILKVNFGTILKPKGKIKIDIEFSLSLPNCTHRFGFYEGNINLGNWYPIACEYENGKFDTTPYYSTGDPFFSSVANYEVELKYPSEYKLCATGVMESTTNSGKTTAKMQAKAVRDYAMCLSNDSVIVSKNIGEITVNYMGYQSDSDLNENLNISVKAIEYFSKTFGKFPYSSLSVVKTPFIYGGMEYPNIVFVSDSLDSDDEMKKVIVHEIAHQWWYSIVGNNEAKEAWLDESLAEYSTALFFKNNTVFGISYDEIVASALSSYLLYVDVIEAIRGEVNTKMNLAVNEYQNDYEYSYMVYVKGVIMFDELRKTVGENKLINGLKKYYETNKFKLANKNSFYEAFKTACHKDLNGFFDGYLNGTTIIASIN